MTAEKETDPLAPGYCNICHNLAVGYNDHAFHCELFYIGFGGRRGSLPGVNHLGNAAASRHGYFRDILYNIAYGYVQGFPLSAIVYYVTTRHVFPRAALTRILDWEQKRREPVPNQPRLMPRDR